MREEQVKLVSPSQRPASSPERGRYEPDGVYPLLPKQYFQLVTGRKLPDGEKRLMLAVLEEAIRSYVLGMTAKSQTGQREFEEVRRWVETRGHRGLFTFENLCEVFDIQPDQLRAQLTAMGKDDLPRRRIGSLGRQVSMGSV